MSGLTSLPSRFLRTAAKIEVHEMKAVMLSFIYATLIFASYNMIKPYRDAMGTVYGARNLPGLFTGTFLAMLVASSIYGAFASRMKLATFLPWVWGFLIINLLAFFLLFETLGSTRPLAAAFYIWVSIYSLLITSVFWSFMADLFSRAQAKRLFGVVTTGLSLGGLIGPAISAALIPVVGLNNMLVCSAALLFAALLLVRSLEKEKNKVAQFELPAGRTDLDHKLGGNPFAGFTHLFRSPYLLMISLFIMLMTWVSTIAYIQQTQLIAKAFASVSQRAQVLATVETIVNTAAFALAILGTGRMTQRFGITATLLVNPLLMIIGFIAIAMSPVLSVFLVVQVARRICEYALARPGREMMFTIIDQENKYKAKNVVDTVIYRLGDVSSSYAAAPILTLFGVPGTALFGVIVCVVWGSVAVLLGRRYEGARAERAANASLAGG
jgi:AAA family ATP:ADP antiporter